MGKTKLEAANRISEELVKRWLRPAQPSSVVFDGTLPVDQIGVIDPETGTIRLNSRVGGPENLRDNVMQLVQEESTGLDSAGSGGYNAGEGDGYREIKGISGTQSMNPVETQTSVNRKLETYLLDKTHVTGGSKAKWFEAALGFNQSNITELSRQIVFNPKIAIQTAITEYGTKYNQIISITGANGKVIDVTFAWI